PLFPYTTLFRSHAHRVGQANARWPDIRDLLDRLELLRECDPVLQRERAVLHQPHDLAFDFERAKSLRRGEHAEPMTAFQQIDFRRECGHARPPLLLGVDRRSRAVERYRPLADSGAGPATGRGEFTEGGTCRLAAGGRGIPYRGRPLANRLGLLSGALRALAPAEEFLNLRRGIEEQREAVRSAGERALEDGEPAVHQAADCNGQAYEPHDEVVDLLRQLVHDPHERVDHG